LTTVGSATGVKS